jgi:uncharacterized protein (TIGR02118 family)
MITRFWLGTRRPGMTREAFSEHWHEVHGPYGLALPGLRAYVQNHRFEGPSGVGAPIIDGCSELDFDDVAAMRSAFASSQIAEADEDERAFADVGRFGVVVTERRPLLGGSGPDTDARLLSFLRVNPRHTRSELAEATQALVLEHAEGAGAVRAEVLVAVDDAPEPQACDVVVSLWFPTREALLTAAPGWAAVEAEALAGVAFGRETVLVRPRRMR